MFFKQTIFIPKWIIKLFQNKIIFSPKNSDMNIHYGIIPSRKKGKPEFIFLCTPKQNKGAPAEAGAPSLMANQGRQKRIA